MDKKKPKHTPPSPNKWHMALEFPTAFKEACSSFHHWVVKDNKRNLPRGNGHPVLLLPGFLAHDTGMFAVKKFLNDMGYNAQHWEGGINWGPSEKILSHMEKRLRQVYKQNGGQKVSLVGWSLGGLYARKLAQDHPDMVRGIVTLGTPHNPGEDNLEDELVGKMFKKINPNINAQDVMDWHAPAQTPITSIYTKQDGVVHWTTCLIDEGKTSENIEIDTSHIGIVLSPQAFTILADRLAQPEGGWQKFNPDSYPASGIKKPRPLSREISKHTPKKK